MQDNAEKTTKKNPGHENGKGNEAQRQRKKEKRGSIKTKRPRVTIRGSKVLINTIQSQLKPYKLSLF